MIPSNKQRPRLIIFRGLPGSGKSSAARKLAAETGAVLIEPDAFCVSGGVYHWTPARWKKACFAARACVELAEEAGADIVYADVLANPQDVIDVTLHAPGYEVTVIDLPCTVEESLKRNRHNVDPEHIKQMNKEWQEWPKTK